MSAKKILDIEPENFFPRPKVKSSLLLIEPKIKFFNFENHKNLEKVRAWELIASSGCRGLRVGDAVVSEKHCNFLINRGNASAQDIEELGEKVRDCVKRHTGINLEWEIKRIGVKAREIIQ